MNRTLPFVALLVLGACAEQPMQADLVKPQAAFSESMNTQRPFAGQFVNPCNADVIELTGYIHERYSVQMDNAGGMRIAVHSNPQGISGTGVSGLSYNANGATNSSQKIKPGAAQTETFVNVFNVIGQGADNNNFKVHEHMHITINANGEPSAVVTRFDVSCK